MSINYSALEFENLLVFRTWLQENHTTSSGIWLVFYKQDAGIPTIKYEDARDEALCFGWIDSVINKVDERRFKLLFTPRKPKSNWSKVNKDRIAVLEAAGRIQAAGWAMIHLAKTSGTWDALNDVEEGVIPDDLQAAFLLDAESEKNFTAFSRSSKRGILEWLMNAKTEATRQKRVAEIVSEAKEGRRANFPIDKKKKNENNT